MTTRPSRTARPRPGRTAPSQGETTDREALLPLTTSLPTFVTNGSDRDFRLLVYDLIRLSNQLTRNRKHFAAYMGVTEAQWLMIMIIAETWASTVGQLAEQLNVSHQFVTIEIGDLVKKDVVERRLNEADRRSAILTLTSKGKRLLREISPVLRTANDIMFRSLTPDRARLLKEIVGGLVADGAAALHELEAPTWREKQAPSADLARSPRRRQP
jgi:DNA-binding MarR family transcriptional regulator